ncbi:MULTISPECIES: cache domain-containing protein [unclassified Rhizobium]|uniref:sensor histidine kinase n=1 Tax=unclassified Rhizobium TaxID=2613769 RepID=UPI00146DF5B0|nr:MULTISPECIES: cache domain-containing protein [unclassified Rhizobium]MBD9454275.1 histidine kinase [Rhizobium sp. RHZ02]NMN70828.1 two-component sensor histidine kinase [Rhizobium sp. 57MFTsu3.2]
MKLKLVAVAAAALAPVVAMLVYNEVALRAQRNEEVRANAAQAARQASSEVDRIIEGVRAMLVSVSAMPAVRHLDAASCNESLKSVAENVPNVRTIFVLDTTGSPVCSSQQIPAGTTFADRDYLKGVIVSRQTVVGTYTMSRISDTAVLPIAMPLMEGDNLKGVVVTGVRLDWLQNRITERGVSPGNAVTIADGKGTILARVPFPERFVGTVIPDKFQSLIHADEPGVIDVTSQDGTERILGFRPIALPGSPLYVSAGFSKEEAFAQINRSTLANMLGIAGGVLLAFVAAFFIGNKFLLAPIERIAATMDSWRNGETKARTGMKGSDELSAVGATLDGLLEELDRRRLESEQVVEERALLMRELAHRVKNGFTLVQAISRQTFSKVEPERYRSFSERLTALARTYDLLLSKETTSSSVREVIVAAMEAHLDGGCERIRLEGPDVVLAADLALPLSLVVHELATNATKYGSLSNETGKVSIAWRKERERLDLTWTESGGPPVGAPARKGFGSVLIERAFPSRARSVCRTDYRPDGLVFELSFTTTEPEPRLQVSTNGAAEQRT